MFLIGHQLSVVTSDAVGLAFEQCHAAQLLLVKGAFITVHILIEWTVVRDDGPLIGGDG